MYAYVGSRTTRERNARGEGISVYRLAQETGHLELVQVVGDLHNPSFLAMNRAGTRLYSVHGDSQEVSAFKVDRQTGRLAFLNQQDCGGKNPVHLALDASERWLVVSNHLSGTLTVMEVDKQGAVGPITQLFALEGAVGPHRVEQPFSKPHFNLFDASGRVVLVPDKGLDRIFSLRFDNGRLLPASQAFVKTREGAGPRHLALHPYAPLAYVINELDSSVTVYRFDSSIGSLQPLQWLPTLPASYTGNSRASEIEVDRGGRFLYASNRGYDSVAVFAIDPVSGLLTAVGYVPSAGRTPRFFALTPNQRFMFVLNEDSDSIVCMAIDPHTGLPTETGRSVSAGSPVCMIFSA